MERDSIIYKTRRKCQVLAAKVLSKETLSKMYYRIYLKKKLDLDKPMSFNEKIQWMKLYYYPQNKLVIRSTDKYEVREIVKSYGYANRLVPLYGVWDRAEDIDWNMLPNQFVLKCNHGCGYNILVHNKQSANIDGCNKQLNKWLKEDFGEFNIEPHYSKIKRRRIICEQYLGEMITDYKFFCFDGKPRFIYVSKDLVHDRQAQIGFFDLNGEKMPLHRDDYEDISEIVLPPFYTDMKIAAEVLSKDYPFVRVDFFISNNTWYFAELTFTPGAGLMPFNPDYYDMEWGKLINLPEAGV